MFPNYSVKNNTDGSSHVVVLPDLQNYSGKNGKLLSVLDETMNWIIE